METGVEEDNPFAPPTPTVVSEPGVGGEGGGGGGGGGIASIGSDNPFAAALTSISLQEGSSQVPSVSATPNEGSTASTADPAAGGGGGSSSIASKLTGSFGKMVDGLGAWASGAGDNDDATAKKQQPNHYPFEDGILGEGLARMNGGSMGRLYRHGDAVAQAEASASARERELERREARIRVKEEILEANLARIKRKNWPPCKPILYHDINAEVPAVNRGMVRAAYTAWLLTATGYVFNFFIVTLMFFGGAGVGLGDWFMAAVFMLSGVPLSWWAWYRGLYSVSQRTQPGFFLTAAYGRFFMNFGFHVLMTAWMIAGLPLVGDMCAGVFTVIGRFTAGTGFSTFLGFCALVNVALWSTVMALSLWVGGAALGRFREGGGVAELRRGRDAAAVAAASISV